MSSFDVLESSLESSRPLEVYRFAVGNLSYLYTSAEDAITLGTDTYEPEAIARDSISQGQDKRKQVLKVTVPSSNAFAQRYVSTQPGQKATLSVTRLQRDEVPTFNTRILVYKGSVQSVNFPDSGEVAEIAVQTIEGATSRTIPRYTYQASCGHVLYGPGCDVNPDSFDHIGTVTAVSGNDITLSGASGAGLDFVGGYCRPLTATDFRLIIAQSGNVLTLLLPFEVSVLNTSVQAFAGCDHVLKSDCALVFNNVANYGGFAFVPKRDIFAKGLS